MGIVRDEMIKTAKKFGGWSTGDGVKFLHLEDTPNNIYAGNTYMTALSVIRELAQENEELRKRLNIRS